MEGQNVSFACKAQGFPLHVEWKLQKYGKDFVRSYISEIMFDKIIEIYVVVRLLWVKLN